MGVQFIYLGPVSSILQKSMKKTLHVEDFTNIPAELCAAFWAAVIHSLSVVCNWKLTIQ